MNSKKNALVLAAVFGAVTASAQSYPQRPITIISPTPPGSTCEAILRPVMQVMQERLGQPLILDFKAGAESVIGTQYVARSRPDGYTLLCSSSTGFSANPTAYKNLPYDPVKDFTSIGMLATTSMMYVVEGKSPTHSLVDLVQAASKKGTADDRLDIGYGFATAALAAALIESNANVKFNMVPYKGAGPLLTDMMGGTIGAGVVDVANGLKHISSGRIRALAITGSARSPLAPNVPTVSELYPGVELVSWVGLSAPAGTPQPIIDKLYAAMQFALQQPQVRQAMEITGNLPEPMAGPAMDRKIARDIGIWGDLIRAAGLERR